MSTLPPAPRRELPLSVGLGALFAFALFVVMALAQMMGDIQAPEQTLEENLVAYTPPEVIELAERNLGSRGLYAAAGASGLADVDAITLAIARQAKANALSAEVAAVAVAIAVMSNMMVKGGIALFAGGWRFGGAIVATFAVSGVLGLVVAFAV